MGSQDLDRSVVRMGSPPHSGEADLLRAARLGAAGSPGDSPGGSPGFVESRDR